MRPFHFGAPQRRLYGVYHPAAPAAGPTRAALLCQGWGPEYDQAHRAMRQLATALATAGIHTLRFDYYATGDSYGDTEEGDIAGWRADVVAAIDELREISGARRVILIGLRIGALLAALAAGDRPELVEALVLWNPVTGGDYLETLRGSVALTLATPPAPRTAGRGGLEVFGHALGATLSRDFDRLDIASVARLVSAPVTLVVSGGEAALAETIDALECPTLAACLNVPERPCWADDGVLASNFVPQGSIRAIVDQLA